MLKVVEPIKELLVSNCVVVSSLKLKIIKKH